MANDGRDRDRSQRQSVSLTITNDRDGARPAAASAVAWWSALVVDHARAAETHRVGCFMQVRPLIART